MSFVPTPTARAGMSPDTRIARPENFPPKPSLTPNPYCATLALSMRKEIVVSFRRVWLSLMASAIVVLGSACSGGGGGTPAPSGPGQTPPASPNPTPTATQAPSPTATPYVGSALYVLDYPYQPFSGPFRTGDIAVFAPGANGNVAPLFTLPFNLGDNPQELAIDSDGSIYYSDGIAINQNTLVHGISIFQAPVSPSTRPVHLAGGLQKPGNVAVDTSSNIYVYDFATHAINVFAKSARDDVAPVRTISGPNTRLGSGVFSLTVVGNALYGIVDNAIVQFPLSASGDVAPTAVLEGPATGLSYPAKIAFDALGRMVVLNSPSGNQTNILVFAPGATGNTAPLSSTDLTAFTSHFSFGFAFCLDAQGAFVLPSVPNDGPPTSLKIFAATGNAFSMTPTSEIVGPLTALVTPTTCTYR